MKNPVQFNRKIIETIYEDLSFDEKYFMDEMGDIWQHDPFGAVRDALEQMKCQLDPAWYSWGTMNPKEVDSSIMVDEMIDIFKKYLPN